MEIAVMIEGQNGLTWPRWQRLVRAVEDLGFAGLYRSDHFTNMAAPDRESLECWISLAWLAAHTRRVEFGPLVSPVSFRHPVFLARWGMQLDDLAGGRLRLGVGAGWQAREHTMFGFDLLAGAGRFARLREALEVITRLVQSEAPVTFAGRFYRLEAAVLLPRPQRAGRLPIVVGGNGPRRTLALAARYADEWNATFQTPERFAALSQRLDALVAGAGRRPQDVRRTLMTGIVFGRTDAEVARRLAHRGVPAEQLRARGVVIGTAGEVVDHLGRLAEAGVQRVMLQWLDLDDLDGLEALAQATIGRT
ncbi:MAG: TIGR03560 family F420-dependent LLM class oxidoreductase [Armatimonadota bacterium]|nr:TIGR03560 family F420-dependent LLM class oxidoreductase [Armatimonadota bacterium]MDR7485038.1 TIGR03560 family F420-dependent LLM class oxidoreductase [Armatimonadota bacterium]MDR7534494.1 TIGR03560 family F420-dependent LLM class oxidoreductase [Armatimonadota bacterium]MDR7535552.1 TIGR03560 family F420-dependent LLM class oxidoreductase [Armatimonadota bacterium]